MVIQVYDGDGYEAGVGKPRFDVLHELLAPTTSEDAALDDVARHLRGRPVKMRAHALLAAQIEAISPNLRLTTPTGGMVHAVRRDLMSSRVAMDADGYGEAMAYLNRVKRVALELIAHWDHLTAT